MAFKKYNFIIPLAFVLILFSFSGVHAIAYFCGDRFCSSDFADYNESDPNSVYYCPQDCGIQTSSEWCEDTYSLIFLRDCPTAPTSPSTPSCDTSRISTSELGNWCNANGYSGGSCSSACPFPFAEKFAVISITGSKCKDGLIIIGLLLLISGGIGGYYYKKKKR